MVRIAALVLLLAGAAAAAAPAPGAADAAGAAGGRALQGFLHHKLGFYSKSAAPAASPAPAPAATCGATDGHRIGGLLTALRCQKVYQNRFGGQPSNLIAALGPACQQATLNPIQCCSDSVALLNQPDLRGCLCNRIVYQQLCGQVSIAGLTCDTLLPTLCSCGLQCS